MNQTLKILNISCIIIVIIIAGISISLLPSTNKKIENETKIEAVNEAKETESLTPNSQKEEIAIKGTDSILHIALFFLIITTLISISISFYLYRWRRILISDKNLLVPEEWSKTLKDVTKNMSDLKQSLNKDLGEMKYDASNNSVKITNMVETYSTLRSALDEREEEIKRLKKGYDSKIFRNFLFRFIRVDRYLADLINNNEFDKNSILDLKTLMEDALEECGVELFSPKEGEDYKPSEVEDNPKIKTTNNSDKDSKISKIIDEGYLLRNGDELEIIKKCKVEIYKFKKQEI